MSSGQVWAGSSFGLVRPGVVRHLVGTPGEDTSLDMMRLEKSPGQVGPGSVCRVARGGMDCRPVGSGWAGIVVRAATVRAGLSLGPTGRG